MLLLMLLPALMFEELLSMLHLHEGLTHTESVSGDFMLARDDRWLLLTADKKKNKLEVAKFEAYHLKRQSTWDSQRLASGRQQKRLPQHHLPGGTVKHTQKAFTQH
jgi:hypothetical protein